MRLAVKATMHRRTDVPASTPTSLGHPQRKLSDRVHAVGDGLARQHGWQITAGTGRFGFGTRSYRDPRFEDMRRRLSAGVAPAGEHDYPGPNREGEEGAGNNAGGPAVRPDSSWRLRAGEDYAYTEAEE